jgi:hypothetical protein
MVFWKCQNLKISGEIIWKIMGNFTHQEIKKKNTIFLAFLNFLENHTISHYFSQFRHNLFVSNAHIIPYYFSLLDLFTEGKFWQLRTMFLGFETKIGWAENFAQFKMFAVIADFLLYVPLFCPSKISLGRPLVQFFHGLESLLLQY